MGVRYQLKQMALSAIDRGLLGFTPLEKHIVICGFPRSGSTLLQLMMSTFLDARVFDEEHRATWIAATAMRNHRYMISKRPNDIYELRDIRQYYANRIGSPTFILTMRDPRDVMVSEHANRPGDYYVDFARWDKLYKALTANMDAPDVFVSRFEDIVLDINSYQSSLSEFLDVEFSSDFGSFHQHDTGSFNTGPMNGIRPLDKSVIGSWRDPKHIERVAAMIQGIPDFSEQLIRLGYEDDDRWMPPFLETKSS